MVPQVNDLGVDVPEISQIGIVVRDMEQAMESYGTFGVGSWDVYRCETPENQSPPSELFPGEKRTHLTDRRYYQNEGNFEMRLAFADLANIQLELIEPLSGTSIYTDHLERHGEGIQHLGCFAYDDAHSVVESFERAGMKVIQSGIITVEDRRAEWWYFDTEERLNGVIFETATGSVQPT